MYVCYEHLGLGTPEFLIVCPRCGGPFEAIYTEDNDNVTCALCASCDITWGWDETGFWTFNRLCTCGKPALINVSNGATGCLDPACSDYMTDHLDPEDYEISGYKEKRRPADIEPTDWDGRPANWKVVYRLRPPEKNVFHLEDTYLDAGCAALAAQNIARRAFPSPVLDIQIVNINEQKER